MSKKLGKTNQEQEVTGGQLSVPIPSLHLLIILGNLAVHTSEYLSPTGHPIDRVVIEDLLNEPELIQWLEKMDELALLPVKR